MEIASGTKAMVLAGAYRPGHPAHGFSPEGVIGLVLVFAAMQAALAALAGWRALAARYRTRIPRPRGARCFVNCNVGFLKLRARLTVAATPDGLYLAQFFMLRLFHPPLLIPWSAVRARREETRWFFWKGERLWLEAGRTIELWLPADVARDLDAYLPAATAL
jgi:hypothetical protein